MKISELKAQMKADREAMVKQEQPAMRKYSKKWWMTVLENWKERQNELFNMFTERLPDAATKAMVTITDSEGQPVEIGAYNSRIACYGAVHVLTGIMENIKKDRIDAEGVLRFDGKAQIPRPKEEPEE